MYIDSIRKPDEIDLHNPARPTPNELVRDMVQITVQHYDFKHHVQTGTIIVHKLVADDVRSFFRQAFEQRFPIHMVRPIRNFEWNDANSCDANNSSAFIYRLVTGGQAVSKHGIGCAFDINPRQNVYIKYTFDGSEMYRIPDGAVYRPEEPGTLTASHPLVIMMKNLGWTWGGDWTPESGRVDYQHFEIVPEPLAHYVK